jgi:hypothetical protein
MHKERMPGSRRDYYRRPDDIWHELLQMRDQIMRRWLVMIREGIELVGPGSPAGVRLADHAAFIEFVSTEFPEVMKRWDEYRARPG